MVRNLQQKMGFLFLAFFTLVSTSVLATSWTVNTQQQDALVINLAGRQRMLIQQMTKDAFQLSHYLHNEYQDNESAWRRTTLQETVDTFEQTLQALTVGGQAPYLPYRAVVLPGTQDPDILAGLQKVHQTWISFRNYLDVIISPQATDTGRIAASQRVEQLSPTLVQQADDVVRLYEAASNRKVARLRWIQVSFFGGALLLLSIGVWMTQRSILTPLYDLDQVADRIGRGDLSTPVTITGPHEMQILADSFDIMRQQLKLAQENLEARVAQRTRELTVAFELSQEIVTELKLRQLLTSVVERAKLLTQAQTAVLCLLTPSGKTLNIAAFSSSHPIDPASPPQPVDRGLAVQVVGQAQTIATDVACANCQFLNQQSGQCTATPLRAGERTLGALCVVRPQQNQFDPDEIRALTLLANSAAIAIDNAHLIETERVQVEQSAILAERNRLSAELHDNLAQTLSFLNLKTDRLTDLITKNQPEQAKIEINRMQAAIKTAYGQVRAALVGLQEPVTAPGDLADDLAACVTDFEAQTQIPARLTINAPTTLALPRIIHTQALHIVREALTNIRRHAHAEQVWVRVECVNGEVHFTIKDNGRGFNPNNVRGNNHLGLMIMRVRVERSGGQLHIVSSPGSGTEVTACFPLKVKNGKSNVTDGQQQVIDKFREKIG